MDNGLMIEFNNGGIFKKLYVLEHENFITISEKIKNLFKIENVSFNYSGLKEAHSNDKVIDNYKLNNMKNGYKIPIAVNNKHKNYGLQIAILLNNKSILFVLPIQDIYKPDTIISELIKYKYIPDNNYCVKLGTKVLEGDTNMNSMVKDINNIFTIEKVGIKSESKEQITVTLYFTDSDPLIIEYKSYNELREYLYQNNKYKNVLIRENINIYASNGNQIDKDTKITNDNKLYVYYKYDGCNKEHRLLKLKNFDRFNVIVEKQDPTKEDIINAFGFKNFFLKDKINVNIINAEFDKSITCEITYKILFNYDFIEVNIISTYGQLLAKLPENFNYNLIYERFSMLSNEYITIKITNNNHNALLIITKPFIIYYIINIYFFVLKNDSGDINKEITDTAVNSYGLVCDNSILAVKEDLEYIKGEKVDIGKNKRWFLLSTEKIIRLFVLEGKLNIIMAGINSDNKINKNSLQNYILDANTFNKNKIKPSTKNNLIITVISNKDKSEFTLIINNSFKILNIINEIRNKKKIPKETKINIFKKETPENYLLPDSLIKDSLLNEDILYYDIEESTSNNIILKLVLRTDKSNLFEVNINKDATITDLKKIIINKLFLFLPTNNIHVYAKENYVLDDNKLLKNHFNNGDKVEIYCEEKKEEKEEYYTLHKNRFDAVVSNKEEYNFAENEYIINIGKEKNKWENFFGQHNLYNTDVDSDIKKIYIDKNILENTLILGFDLIKIPLEHDDIKFLQEGDMEILHKVFSKYTNINKIFYIMAIRDNHIYTFMVDFKIKKVLYIDALHPNNKNIEIDKFDKFIFYTKEFGGKNFTVLEGYKDDLGYLNGIIKAKIDLEGISKDIIAYMEGFNDEYKIFINKQEYGYDVEEDDSIFLDLNEILDLYRKKGIKNYYENSIIYNYFMSKDYNITHHFTGNVIQQNTECGLISAIAITTGVSEREINNLNNMTSNKEIIEKYIITPLKNKLKDLFSEEKLNYILYSNNKNITDII